MFERVKEQRHVCHNLLTYQLPPHLLINSPPRLRSRTHRREVSPVVVLCDTHAARVALTVLSTLMPLWRIQVRPGPSFVMTFGWMETARAGLYLIIQTAS